MTPVIRRVAQLFACLILTLGAGVATARGGPALPAAPAMIVIAQLEPSADELEDEAYGDWAHYLNEFAATRPDRLTIARLSPAQWRRLTRAPIVRERRAIIFLRPGGRALVHDGMAFEPQVYLIGHAWARGRPASDARSLGLREARLVRRR